MSVLVCIKKNWNWPEIIKQTPGNKGVWGDFKFTEGSVKECDYLIILNGIPNGIEIKCAPERIWRIVQEPPTEFNKSWHINPSYSFKTFTCDSELSGLEYIHSHPALPWHVNKNYDYLVSCKVPKKTSEISWVTSNVSVLEGHRQRLRFLENIKRKIEFDLFGMGFDPIKDKWDGLAPYKYSFAIENFSNPCYWSEKISDCFLAWTMPIYYGCTRITDYFPSESIIQIDINSPDCIDQIKCAISNDKWRRNLDAIAYSRELVLKKYQLFPFIVNQIQQFESCYGSYSVPQHISISPKLFPPKLSIQQRVIRCLYQDEFNIIRILSRILKKIKG